MRAGGLIWHTQGSGKSSHDGDAHKTTHADLYKSKDHSRDLVA